MFIRKRHNKSGSTSIQVVQKSGSSLKVLKHFGTATTDKGIDHLTHKAKEWMSSSNLPLFNSNTQLSNIEVSNSFLIGFHEVFGKIFDDIGYSDILSNRLLKDLVIARIAKPTSKLGTFRWLSERIGREELEKDRIYRCMDSLDEDIEQLVTDHTYNFVKTVIKKTINIIFFDATTLHFETFKSDSFRLPGFSKVGKHNQPQIVIGLMVTEDGLPIGYDVYPGNQFDGHTIRSALTRVSRRYSVSDVIFVADNGMMSNDNTTMIEKAGFKFIMAARIKNMSNFYKNQILDDSKYKNNILELDYGMNKRLIVSYSSDRARKDRTDREKNIEQIKKRLTKRSKITKSKLGKIGRSKYLYVDGDAEVSINYQAIQADEVWDGLKGYMTNIPMNHLPAKKIIEKYCELWQVEKAFRVSKSELNIRPIYHYKRKRIRAHILIVFMSLVISRYTELLLKDLSISTKRLVELLETIQLIEIHNPKTGEKVLRKTPLNETTQKIYSLLGVDSAR